MTGSAHHNVAAHKTGIRPLGGEWQAVGLTDIGREEVRVASGDQRLLSWLEIRKGRRCVCG